MVHSRSGFQNQVEQSSENAKLALESVPKIENQLREIDTSVQEAEKVWIDEIFRRQLTLVELFI